MKNSSWRLSCAVLLTAMVCRLPLAAQALIHQQQPLLAAVTHLSLAIAVTDRAQCQVLVPERIQYKLPTIQIAIQAHQFLSRLAAISRYIKSI